MGKLDKTGYPMTGGSPDECWPLIRDFHYSRRMPANIQHCYVVREPGGLFGDTGRVMAAAMFSIPPTRWSFDVLELSRLVRTNTFKGHLSQLIGFSCNQLRKQGHHLLVSFADWTQSHHGGVYQSAGWMFAGQRDRRMDGLIVNGEFKPGRSCNSTWGTRSPSSLSVLLPDADIQPHYDEGKFLYWRALTVAGKTRAKRLKLKNLPYPKPDNAARPLDAPSPNGESQVQPLGAAP